jgi:hypothetical protein
MTWTWLAVINTLAQPVIVSREASHWQVYDGKERENGMGVIRVHTHILRLVVMEETLNQG